MRLSQSEVDQFGQEGTVSGKTDFVNQSLVYTLQQSGSASEVSASFENNKIIISVPSATAKEWLNPENIGFQSEEKADISILVEKDFECLHKRPNEDESDNFPNPQAIEK